MCNCQRVLQLSLMTCGHLQFTCSNQTGHKSLTCCTYSYVHPSNQCMREIYCWAISSELLCLIWYVISSCALFPSFGSWNGTKMLNVIVIQCSALLQGYIWGLSHENDAWSCVCSSSDLHGMSRIKFRDSVHVCEPHTHTIREPIRCYTWIETLIISYNMCVRPTHITYYKRISTCKYLIGHLIVCVCGSHTWTEPQNPFVKTCTVNLSILIQLIWPLYVDLWWSKNQSVCVLPGLGFGKAFIRSQPG